MKFLKIEKSIWLSTAVLMWLSVVGYSQEFEREAFDDPMDATKCDVDGWHVLYDGTPETAAENLWLSNASHGDGGNWWVDVDPDAENTNKIAPGQLVLWSDQNQGGSGGIMYTHRAYENVEVNVSFWPGWRNDGGLFLRSNGTGGAYQVMFDYQPNNRIGGIWHEQITADRDFPYSLISETSIEATGIDWPVEDWAEIWDPDGYNTLNAEIIGETFIYAWLTDEDHVVTDYTQGSNAPELNETGYVGLQIHAGEGSWQGGPNRYLWLKVREKDDEGNVLCIGTKTSACNIEGYKEYDVNHEIGDPSKCMEFGDPVPGCLDDTHPSYNPDATVHDPAMCVVGVNYQVLNRNLLNNMEFRQDEQNLVIKGQFENSYLITVRTLSGKTLATFTGGPGAGEHTLNTDNSGLYIIEAVSGQARVMQKFTLM